MADPKQVIAPTSVKTVQETVKATPASPRKPVFRFVKTLSPAEVITLPSGRQIQFNVPQDHVRAYSRTGKFETDDAKLAEEIRTAASKMPLYIFEQK